MKFLPRHQKVGENLRMNKQSDAQQEHYLGHRARLKERFLKSSDSLPDYELLELILSYAIPRKDVKPLAKHLIDRFKGFDEVFAASFEDLITVSGIKENTATFLKVISETGIRSLKSKTIKRPVMSKWSEIVDFCRLKIGKNKEESLHLLWLNKQLELVEEECHQQGTVDSAHIYPQEIARRALSLRASYLIMTHNHPSGKLKPSQDDIDSTFDVKNALSVVGVNLYDHIIVSKEGYYSFKEKGLLL